MPAESASSSAPSSSCRSADLEELRRHAERTFRRVAEPVMPAVRRAFAAAADDATLDGSDRLERLRELRDSLVRAVDDAVLDELARWDGPAS